MPLTYAALDVASQTIVEVDPLLRTELVNNSLAQFERLHHQVEEKAGTSVRALGRGSIAGSGELESRLGIRYLAPRDARDTGLPGGASTSSRARTPWSTSRRRTFRRSTASVGACSDHVRLVEEAGFGVLGVRPALPAEWEREASELRR